jgi:hypothetical protein
VILPPEKTSFGPDAQTLAISPNGRSIVFAAAATGEATRLWVRPLDSLVATVLAGTEDARMPFWSPDSASVGFFAGGKLKRVAVQGGPVQALADVDLSFHLAMDGSLMSVSVKAGGTFAAEAPRVLFATRLDPRALRQTYSVSPDGERFLFQTPVEPTMQSMTAVVNWPELLRK